MYDLDPKFNLSSCNQLMNKHHLMLVQEVNEVDNVVHRTFEQWADHCVIMPVV